MVVMAAHLKAVLLLYHSDALVGRERDSAFLEAQKFAAYLGEPWDY
jgi:hypothetical protein